MTVKGCHFCLRCLRRKIFPSSIWRSKASSLYVDCQNLMKHFRRIWVFYFCQHSRSVETFFLLDFIMWTGPSPEPVCAVLFPWRCSKMSHKSSHEGLRFSSMPWFFFVCFVFFFSMCSCKTWRKRCWNLLPCLSPGRYEWERNQWLSASVTATAPPPPSAPSVAPTASPTCPPASPGAPVRESLRPHQTSLRSSFSDSYQ